MGRGGYPMTRDVTTVFVDVSIYIPNVWSFGSLNEWRRGSGVDARRRSRHCRRRAIVALGSSLSGVRINISLGAIVIRPVVVRICCVMRGHVRTTILVVPFYVVLSRVSDTGK